MITIAMKAYCKYVNTYVPIPLMSNPYHAGKAAWFLKNTQSVEGLDEGVAEEGVRDD